MNGTAATVDVHAHYLPRAIADALETAGHHRIRRVDEDDLAGRIAVLDEAGIDVQVLSLGALQPYGPDLASATAGARVANDVYQEAVDRSDGRFAAFGCVPLAHPAAAAVEAVRCLDDLGFPGIGLGCSVAGTALDRAGLEPLWDALNERRAVVYLHPGLANNLAVGIDEYPMLLGPAFGSPTETAVAVVRLILGGVTVRYPGIRFVAACAGGTIPFGWAKLRHNAAAAAEIGAPLAGPADPEILGRLDEQIRRFHFDTSTFEGCHGPAVQSAYGLDRLVFGSDAPWGSPVEAAAALAQALGEPAAAQIRTRAAALLQR